MHMQDMNVFEVLEGSSQPTMKLMSRSGFRDYIMSILLPLYQTMDEKLEASVQEKEQKDRERQQEQEQTQVQEHQETRQKAADRPIERVVKRGTFTNQSWNTPSPAMQAPVRQHTYSRTLFRKEVVGHQQPISPRDLRQLDVNTSKSTEPFLAVRKMALMIKLDPYRVVILKDRLFILLHPGADEVLGKFLNHTPIVSQPHFSFELAAVEAVFRTYLDRYEEENRLLSRQVQEMLSHMKSMGVSKELDRLRDYKHQVTGSLLELKRVQGAIEDVLDDESELTFMQLTKLIDNPFLFWEAFTSQGSHRLLYEATEAQMEDYLQHVAEMLTQLQLLQQQIGSAEGIVNLKLDASRNKLLAIGMVLSLISAIFAGGSFIAGVFGESYLFLYVCVDIAVKLILSDIGMNLANGREDSRTAFTGVVVTSSVVMLAVFGVGFYLMIRAGLLMF